LPQWGLLMLTDLDTEQSEPSRQPPPGKERLYYAGVDIGGSKVAALVTGEPGRQPGEAVVATVTDSPAALVDSIVTAVKLAAAAAAVDPARLVAIGAGVPGQVNPQTGEVRLAVNLKLQAYPLGEVLSARLKAAVYLENDVRLATVGAYHWLIERERVTHMAYLSVGTGIATGLILDGRLYRGANGMAGEIGHLVVQPGGPACNCGLNGCLETLTSGPAIVRQAAAVMPTSEPLTVTAVYQAAEAGDQAARAVVEQVSGYLARAIQLLIMSYDVEKVILGGGVAQMGERFLQPILRELAQLRQQSALATLMLPDERITCLPAGYNAGVWGGVMLARGRGEGETGRGGEGETRRQGEGERG
jgi:glucokinase